MSARTSDTEVSGTVVHIIHAEWNSTDSVYDRTVLALCNKDNLSLAIEEEEATFNPAAERRTRRYRTNNTATFEVSSAINVDLEAMELIGLVDSNGEVVFDTTNRRLDPMDGDGEFIEVAYFDAEGADYSQAQLVHRLEDVEMVSPTIEMSETPPVTSWSMWIHGAIQFAYTGE